MSWLNFQVTDFIQNLLIAGNCISSILSAKETQIL